MAKHKLTGDCVAELLETNQVKYQKNLNGYFGQFETRRFTKAKYKLRGEKPIGYTGKFFEQYSALSQPNEFDGNNVSAAICLSITGSGFWVSSLLNEKFDLKPLEIKKYEDISDTPDEYFADGSKFQEIYKRMLTINGIGPVTATKLLASIAPSIFPVRDRDVSRLFEATNLPEPFEYLEWCRKMRLVMKHQDVRTKLDNMRAKLGHDLSSASNAAHMPSLLRVFDVVFWVEAQ